MCCVKVYYLSWTFLSLKLKKEKRGVGGVRKRERGRGELKKEGNHQLRFARSIKLLDLEMFSSGAHFLRLRVVNGA